MGPEELSSLLSPSLTPTWLRISSPLTGTIAKASSFASCLQTLLITQFVPRTIYESDASTSQLQGCPCAQKPRWLPTVQKKITSLQAEDVQITLTVCVMSNTDVAPSLCTWGFYTIIHTVTHYLVISIW